MKINRNYERIEAQRDTSRTRSHQRGLIITKGIVVSVSFGFEFQFAEVCAVEYVTLVHLKKTHPQILTLLCCNSFSAISFFPFFQFQF